MSSLLPLLILVRVGDRIKRTKIINGSYSITTFLLLTSQSTPRRPSRSETEKARMSVKHSPFTPLLVTPRPVSLQLLLALLLDSSDCLAVPCQVVPLTQPVPLALHSFLETGIITGFTGQVTFWVLHWLDGLNPSLLTSLIMNVVSTWRPRMQKFNSPYYNILRSFFLLFFKFFLAFFINYSKS